MKKKRILITVLMLIALVTTALGLSGITAFANDEQNSFDKSISFTSLSGQEMLDEMGMGWNLGNALDANTGQMPNESAWGSPVTTKEMIKTVHDLGYNTLRIPTTWGTMIDETTYEINPMWLNRVQDVVDYAIELDMYVMLNMHHDGAENGGWLALGVNGTEPWKKLLEKFAGAWSSIAERFKNYDEHLIFAGMNEVTNGALFGSPDRDRHVKISELNQSFIDAVRQTGGNNTLRWLIAASRYASPDDLGQSGWTFPKDTLCTAGVNRIMVEVHHYNSGDATAASQRLYNARNVIITKAKTRGVTEFVPMVLGEFGFVSGLSNDFGNWGKISVFEATVRASKVYGYAPVIWDTPGQVPNTLFDRSDDEDNGKAYGPTDNSATKTARTWRALARAIQNELPATLKASNTGNDVVLNTVFDLNTDVVRYTDSGTNSENDIVKPITSFNVDDTLVLRIGEKIKLQTTDVLPQDTRDVLIWTSTNDHIATTFNGLVTGKTAGKTTITVLAQGVVGAGGIKTTFSGSGETTRVVTTVKKTINVTVVPNRIEDKINSISLLEEDNVTSNEGEQVTGLSVVAGEQLDLTPVVLPIATNDFLTYTSSNVDVASVNRVGRISSFKIGTVFITVASSSGFSKTFILIVQSPGKAEKVDVAINVMYADSRVINANEFGQIVSITGDGQYTVWFDVDEHMSPTNYSNLTANNSIATINKLVSVYIKDYDVLSGKSTQTPLDSAKLRYDSIKVSNRDGDEKDYAIRTYSDLNSASKSYDSSSSTTYNGWYNRGASTANGVLIKDEIDDTFWKNPLKPGTGVFDSNDPINGWDGSIIKDVSIADKASWSPKISFNDITNPSRIEITFTLKDVEFSDPIMPESNATDISRDTSKNIILNAGDSAEIAVQISPSITTTVVSFDSSNNLVAIVDNNSIVTLDNAGIAKINVYGVRGGIAIITARTNKLGEDGKFMLVDFIVTISTYKDELNTKYNELKDIDGSLYMAETFAPFSQSLIDAKAILDNDDASQEEVDDILVELVATYNALKLLGKDELIAFYDEVKDVNASNYTQDSFTVFNNKLIDALAVINDDNATQASINQVLAELETAYLSLVDISALKAKITECEALVESEYIVTTWAPFETALTTAQAVVLNNGATVSEISQAITDLTTAKNNLEKIGDKTDLKTYYNQVKNTVETEYTKDSFASFKTNLLRAKTVLENANATQTECDNALNDLTIDFNSLVSIVAILVRYNELKDIINTNYTTDSWTVFNTALTNVKSTIEKDNASVAEVSTALTELNTAFGNLVSVDKTALQSKYNELKDTTKGNYTDSSFANLTSKLNAAKTVLDNGNAIQAEVSTALTELNTAFGNLVSVDKTALQSKYNELKDTAKGNYTDSSFANLTSKLNAAKTVLDNGNATQAEVDTALTELNTAFSSLESVDKTVLQAKYNELKDTEKGNYTDDSYNELSSKLTNAKTVLDNGNATQAQVDTALSELDTAFSNLATNKKSGCGNTLTFTLATLSATMVCLAFAVATLVAVLKRKTK